jgi:hypothetical protein
MRPNGRPHDEEKHMFTSLGSFLFRFRAALLEQLCPAVSLSFGIEVVFLASVPHAFTKQAAPDDRAHILYAQPVRVISTPKRPVRVHYTTPSQKQRRLQGCPARCVLCVAPWCERASEENEETTTGPRCASWWRRAALAGGSLALRAREPFDGRAQKAAE